MKEKLLICLDTPYYKVNTLGEIYRFKYRESLVHPNIIFEIRQKIKEKKISKRQCSRLYKINIKSLNTILGGDDGWVLMKPKIHKGRYDVCLTVNNKVKTHSLHRLILLAFIGPCPENMEACHNNGNGLDNRLENLRWDTRLSNNLDKIKHGTVSRGEKHGMSKLSEKDILNIRELNLFLITSEIGQIYDLTTQYINKIIKYKTWRHLK